MSLSKPKIPPPPAAAPAQASLDTPRRELGGGGDEKAAAAGKRKKGRAGLRIDLQTGGAGLSTSGVGANVPL